MADVSQIKINNVTYNIKDPAIRGEVASIYAPKDAPAFTGVPTAPTAASSTDDTQIATTAFAHKLNGFKLSDTIPSACSSYTITNDLIDDENLEVVKIEFGTYSNVKSDVTWTTNVSTHTLTLAATFSGSTTVKVSMKYSPLA